MRKLTIKREKTFVGCMAKLRVFIEDPNVCDLSINGVSCRKIGEIRNDEEKSFEIGDASARVFIIADTLSKGYCNELYRLPQGSEDIYLSGKCRFNIATGNAFRFDGVNDPEVLENRKKGFIGIFKATSNGRYEEITNDLSG